MKTRKNHLTFHHQPLWHPHPTCGHRGAFSILSMVLLVFCSSGCSNYIAKLHRELDRKPVAQSNLDFYRKKVDRPLGPIAIKRQYQDIDAARKRHRASDLYDQTNTESLWCGPGKDPYLFVDVQRKKPGDIVIINVMEKLKEQITMELKKAFPISFRSKNAGSATNRPSEAAPAAAPAAGAPGTTENNTIYDRISSVITEEINPHHFLLRGRKEILFNEIKRTIEIQALIDRKAINYDDIVNSPSILEAHIVVVK
ncbi:MAG: flagellar basal body L-ring protein FlgH [Bacteriovoracaceae bacterium]|nr:flagellar basal body L-ring protein FlgH [Bacteriovoracaceae bacterium]